jgi:serine protease AprX
MKYFYILLLVSAVASSQTANERMKIISSYNRADIAKLNDTIQLMDADQKTKIADYKKRHPSFQDSETKSLQRFYNGMPIFFTTFNAGSSQTIKTNTMYPGGSLGLSVTGAGITAAVWDGSAVRSTHTELTGRVTQIDANTDFSSHATHVMGTILASGVSSTRKGIAYGATGKAYDWTSDTSEMSAYATQGFLVSNHSYGYVAANLSIATFGAYDGTSVQYDQLANTYPYYQIVKAAGNDRNDTSLEQVQNKGGYDLITGAANAKNVLTVAAVEQVNTYVNAASVVMSDFSSYGPTDDGRVKPDIAAKGVNVNSLGSLTNNQYAVLSGTSMAAPAITGMIVMLQKHFNNLNASSFMRSSTVRGLICHSASEAGLNTGPDYEFGWGLANAEGAANIITNRNVSTVLEENTLTSGQTFTKTIAINTAQNITATICWTDPTGVSNNGAEDNRTPRLKNNLDLKILKDGNTYYPWKLNVEDPTAAATNISDNDVDNVEKVEIFNAEPGVYTIQVTHKAVNLVGNSQVFSLIANGSIALNLNTNDYAYDNSIFIYPNPANNVLNFDVKNNIAISGVSINDISGKEIYRAVDSITNSIDVSNLSSGVYFVTFKSDNNSVTKKFIKE